MKPSFLSIRDFIASKSIQFDGRTCTNEEIERAADEIAKALCSITSSKKFVQMISDCYAWAKFYNPSIFSELELAHIYDVNSVVYACREAHTAIPWTWLDDKIYNFYMDWLDREEFVHFMFKIFLRQP